jgi:hypothetical protein
VASVQTLATNCPWSDVGAVVETTIEQSWYLTQTYSNELATTAIGEVVGEISQEPDGGLDTTPPETLIFRPLAAVTIGNMGWPLKRLSTHPVVATLLDISPVGGWLARSSAPIKL